VGEIPSSSVELDLDAGFRLVGLDVHPANGSITGSGGSEQVDPKVMAVLVALARRPGQAVTRESLLDEVWPDRVVTDDVLSRCIYQLRRHLVSAAGSQDARSLLETLPRRGYRLNATVLPALSATGSEGLDRNAVWLTGLLFLLLFAVTVGWWMLAGDPHDSLTEQPPGLKSIAVLPFVDLSEDGDQEYFADGVSEEVLNSLTRIPSLRVIARSSSFSFKGKYPDIATVANKLNVTHVLEGSVRRSGDRVRITAQLIDAADSSHLWSQTFEREFDDIFIIQDEIALAVAGILEQTLGKNASRLAAPSPDPQAYALNLRAWFLFNRRAPGDLAQAEGYYRQALEIDPEYATAWAGLSGVYFIQAHSGEREFSEGLALARETAERAVRLDPTVPEAQARLGRVLWHMEEREAAAEHMAWAARYGQNSSLVLGMLAGNAYFNGRYDEAIALSRRATEFDPLNLVVRNNLAGFLMAAGRLEEARDEILAALEIWPEAGSGRRTNGLILVGILVLQDKPNDALKVIVDWPEGRNRDHALVLIHAIDGQSNLFEAAVARLAGAIDFGTAIVLAEAFALRGDIDAAFGWLETAAGQIEPGDISALAQHWESTVKVLKSPFLNPLRSDPRWTGWLLNPRELAKPADSHGLDI
jgi:adenylate cyclase